MKLTGENRKTRGGKTCPSATLSTTNPTWTDFHLFISADVFNVVQIHIKALQNS
jgi:hypothetical protein